MPRPNRSNSSESTQAILRHWRESAPGDRLAHLIKDTWRGMLRAFQTRLGEHRVSSGHWLFLRILWERDGLTLSELSIEAGLRVPTTFAAVNAMERLGYVVRRRQEDSRWKVYVFLTPKGKALRAKLVPLAEEVNAVAVRGVPKAKIADMRQTLLVMMENLAEDELALHMMKRSVPSTRDLAHVGRGKAPAKRPSGLNGKARSGGRGTRKSKPGQADA